MQLNKALILRWLPTVALVVFAEYGIWSGTTTSQWLPKGAAAVAVGALPFALLWRQRYPMSVWAVSLGGWLFLGTTLSGSPSSVLTVVVALFACARFAKRPAALVAPALTMFAVIAAATARTEAGSVWEAFIWSLNVLWIFALGAWLREKDELVRLTESQAQERAQLATTQERLRIAREMHDVLAHSISVMVVQAEAADELLDTNPANARRAIVSVQDAGRAALVETRRFIGTLRDEGAPTATATFSLDEAFSQLATRMNDAGLRVTIDPAPHEDLDPAVAQALYRIGQEALTNVLRHAGVGTRVQLSMAVSETRWTMTVRDFGGAADVVTPGNGIQGMQERAASLGGSVTVNGDALGCVVMAEFPRVSAQSLAR